MSHNDFLIMIERHYNLTCYVLEYPIKVLHSFLEQKLLYLIDSNQDIYQLDLSQPNIYEVSTFLPRKSRERGVSSS